jgi:hypothetical protein
MDMDMHIYTEMDTGMNTPMYVCRLGQRFGNIYRIKELDRASKSDESVILIILKN